MTTPAPAMFRFITRAWFRISPGPGWVWPVPLPGGDDAPVGIWPTPEYVAMRDALAGALTGDAPTLSYEDATGGGPRSLQVVSVSSEIPTRADSTGTALASGTLVFDTACFNPVVGAGPGARLGEWLAWVEFSYGGGQAGVQLQSLDLLTVQPVSGDGEGGGMCEPTGGRLYLRSAEPANG